jgi:acetyl-CoA carboxylase carboxyl transferase subunit alpha
MVAPLEFEKDIAELESKLEGLRHFSGSKGISITEEIERLEKKHQKLLELTYKNLTPWQKVLVARHAERPHFLDFLKEIISDFEELSGDRTFGEDKAIVGGIGRFDHSPVVVLGHEKGHDTETRLRHNFGMPKPEGYRKARRLMELADHFQLPLLTFVDTSGANPGVEAEERGQAEAIARCIQTMLDLKVPIITTITGEGGSGGAIAIAVGNEILMLEHAIYSVVTPEGCASILWRTVDKKREAAAAQKFTAQDLLKLGVIDRIIPEPLGGAHRNPQATINTVKRSLTVSLAQFKSLSPEAIRDTRRQKFLQMGKHGL